MSTQAGIARRAMLHHLPSHLSQSLQLSDSQAAFLLRVMPPKQARKPVDFRARALKAAATRAHCRQTTHLPNLSHKTRLHHRKINLHLLAETQINCPTKIHLSRLCHPCHPPLCHPCFCNQYPLNLYLLLGSCIMKTTSRFTMKLVKNDVLLYYAELPTYLSIIVNTPSHCVILIQVSYSAIAIANIAAIAIAIAIAIAAIASYLVIINSNISHLLPFATIVNPEPLVPPPREPSPQLRPVSPGRVRNNHFVLPIGSSRHSSIEFKCEDIVRVSGLNEDSR